MGLADMKKIFVFIFLVTLLGAQQLASAGETASVTLSPADQDAHWQAHFSLDGPATELVLIRPSSGGRLERWQFKDQAFELIQDKETDEDVIRRKDGGSFTTVSITEPTTFDMPAKGYLPFAKFGDGGVLLYTGRFHACVMPCPKDDQGDEGPWVFTVDPGPGERMIANGAVASGPISFKDSADGTKIYVGDGRIQDTATYLAVIDDALPPIVRDDLNRLFPKLMTAFAERLGAPDGKQMMFVSYNVPGTVKGSSIKGGTLPGQVFMHFEGAQTEDFAGSPEFKPFLAWFFAHEAAHLHQHSRGLQTDQGDSWIHEGGAEALAYVLLQELGTVDESYLDNRIIDQSEKCNAALERGSLYRAHERDDFDAYYDCGLIIQLFAHREMQRNGRSLYDLWTNYMTKVDEGADWSTETMLDTIKESAGPEAATFARNITKAEGPLTNAKFEELKRVANSLLINPVSQE